MTNEKSIHWFSTEHLLKRSYFYAGGEYKTAENGEHYLADQMYVEAYMPKKITKPYPLILFHGKGQTCVNWYGTPDGREGWLDILLKHGYVVYLVEQPTRGRSAWYPSDGETTYQSVETVEKRFTNVADKGYWPQAKLHTRWPKSCQVMGSEGYNQFMASQVQFLKDDKIAVKLVVNACGDLLERTGPAVILTHSQAGRFAWPIADKYYKSVMGVIAIEPNGPPFSSDPNIKVATNYGITDEPLTFDPPINTPAEASYHVQYDWLTSKFLTEAGVQHDYMELADVGIHGNGHMVMMEDNSEEICEIICNWLDGHGL